MRRSTATRSVLWRNGFSCVAWQRKDSAAQANFSTEIASVLVSCVRTSETRSCWEKKAGTEVMPNAKEVKMRFAGVLLCGAVLAIVPAMAQDTPPPPPAQGDAQGPPPGGRGGGGMMNPARRLEMMQKQLNLSPEQSTAIKAILDDEQTKMEAMRADTTMSREDRRSKMTTMHEAEKTKIEAVLTKDQNVKYEEMEARMRERRQQGGGGDGPPPPPPPQ